MRNLTIFTIALICLFQTKAFFATSQGLTPQNSLPTAPNVSPPTTQENHGGWVNPEDLLPLPQCIAQQPHEAWLGAMTQCISHGCTRHFGIICTRHEWLVRLDCLSESFGPEVVAPFYALCNRSVLAKAQLYSWIRTVTARNWLVNAGDSVDVQNLSWSPLALGFETTEVSIAAPMCFRNSHVAATQEKFENVLASCSFTAETQSIGNSRRPWEYDQNSHSMVALSFDTASYAATMHHIPEGEYFDKKCFCDTMAPDISDGTCPNGPGKLSYTKEVLWIHALCGANYLPQNWTTGTKTTDYTYIPRWEFKWPVCVGDFPRRTLELKERCASEACAIDDQGYCRPVPAIERACVCRNIRYESAKGSCHELEGRIDYVNWLQGLCGNEEDWNGLPYDWQRLAVLTAGDLIPWNWTLEPQRSLMSTPRIRDDECLSTNWKGVNLVAINIILALAVIYIDKGALHKSPLNPILHKIPQQWYKKAFAIVAISLLANWFNSLSVQSTPGYEHMKLSQLMFLWGTMPKSTWLWIFILGNKPVENLDITAIMAFICSEIILVCLGAWYILVTVFYGLQHNFYFGGLTGVENGGWALMMYFGAATWVFLALWVLTRLVRSRAYLKAQEHIDARVDALRDEWQDKCHFIDAQILEQLTGQPCKSDRTPLNWEIYVQKRSRERYGSVSLMIIAALGFSWIAQSFLWAGFIGFSSNL
ncbi:hypothetical protein IQ07DRAFT_606332 [Pyrenochaeta sp. DS3sAY3a]|nr:hypothetical protein IQ07DRAFT_606332 [Pyrenochaeta sp. DS3sAY3a]